MKHKIGRISAFICTVLAFLVLGWALNQIWNQFSNWLKEQKSSQATEMPTIIVIIPTTTPTATPSSTPTPSQTSSPTTTPSQTSSPTTTPSQTPSPSSTPTKSVAVWVFGNDFVFDPGCFSTIMLGIETNRNTLIIVDYFYDGVNFSERYGITRQEYTVPAGTSTIKYGFEVLPHRNTKTVTYLRIMNEDNIIGIIEIRYYIRDVEPFQAASTQTATSTPTPAATPTSTPVPIFTPTDIPVPTVTQWVIEPKNETGVCFGHKFIVKSAIEYIYINGEIYQYHYKHDNQYWFEFTAGEDPFKDAGSYIVGNVNIIIKATFHRDCMP